LQNLCEEVSDMVAGSEACISGESLSPIIAHFPVLFSPILGRLIVPRTRLNSRTPLLCVHNLIGMLRRNLRSLRRW
jgi:hypothetical protein